MARVSKAAEASVISLPTTEIGQQEVGVLGITPYLHNRMSEKARRTLLYPSPRKNTAERAASLKHDPVEEFRASPYQLLDDENAPTLLAVMASAFKGAMMTAALDLPGVSKAQIGRLVWVEGHYVPIWGTAQLHMSVTRSADIGKTPDIRTRAITPAWGTIIMLSYVQPLITRQTVVNLLTTGGRSSGVGDWRPEKGKGTFGPFELVNTDDPRLVKVMENGRDVQTRALEDANTYDAESAELLGWYETERKERGR
jgi:hypothetical protein